MCTTMETPLPRTHYCFFYYSLIYLCLVVFPPPATHSAPLSKQGLSGLLAGSASSSSGLNGGKVRQFMRPSGGLSGGLSAGLDSGLTTTLGGSLLSGSASDSPMSRGLSSSRPRGTLSTSGGSSFTSGLGISQSKRGFGGSASLGTGGGLTPPGAASPPSHPHRHGHGSSSRNHRAAKGSYGASPRVVRMECRQVPDENLRALLGPAYNGRYMSIDTPPDFRPPSMGGGLHPLPARASSSKGTKWTLGGAIMGDAPDEEDADGKADDILNWGSLGTPEPPSVGLSGGLFVEHQLLDGAPTGEDATDDAPGLFSVGEIRGTPVLSVAIPVTPPPAQLRKRMRKKKLDVLEKGALQGDQSAAESVILVGLDALTGLPEFTVENNFRRDLPQEASLLQREEGGLLEKSEVHPSLLFLLRGRFNSTVASLNRTATALPAASSSPTATEPEIDTGGARKKRAALGASSDKFSGPGATEPWQCASELVWEDLGEDHYPRYIRRTKCVQTGCYNSFYACRERSFTIKVLRRRSDRCVPVYGVTVSAGAGGVPTVQKNRLLRYEQEWIFEERALPFCCECAPRFL